MACWSLPTAAPYRRTVNLVLDVIMSGYIVFPQCYCEDIAANEILPLLINLQPCAKGSL